MSGPIGPANPQRPQATQKTTGPLADIGKVVGDPGKEITNCFPIPDDNRIKPGTQPLPPTTIQDAVLKAQAKTEGLTGTVEETLYGFPMRMGVFLTTPDGKKIQVTEPPELVAALKAAVEKAPPGSTVTATIKGDYEPGHEQGDFHTGVTGYMGPKIKADDVDLHTEQAPPRPPIDFRPIDTLPIDGPVKQPFQPIIKAE